MAERDRSGYEWDQVENTRGLVLERLTIYRDHIDHVVVGHTRYEALAGMAQVIQDLTQAYEAAKTHDR